MRRFAPLIGLLLLTAALYLAVGAAGFAWDDHWLFENTFFRQATLGELVSRDLWAGTVGDGAGPLYYRPLLQASFFVDRSLFGLSPSGWHLHSLAWHLLAVVLLYLLIRRVLTNQVDKTPAGPGFQNPASEQPSLVRDFWEPIDLPSQSKRFSWLLSSSCMAVLGAGVFALHPVQSEAVAWIAARNDPMATVFVLASLLLLLPGKNGAVWSTQLTGALCYAAAISAKESAASVPLILFLLERARQKPLAPHPWLRYGGLLAVLLTLIGLKAGLGMHQSLVDNLLATKIVFSRLPTLLGSYGLLLIKPWPLVATRSLDDLGVGLSLERLLGLAVLVALPCITLLSRSKAKRRLAAAALLAAFFSFAPTLVAIVNTHLLGERYLYMPMAFLGLWVAVLAPRRFLTLGVAGVALLAALVIVHLRLPDWSSSITLFAADVSHQPGCYSRSQYAGELLDAGQLEAALQVTLPALGQARACPQANRLAMRAASRLKDWRTAIEVGEQGLKVGLALAPDFVGELAWACAHSHDWARARSFGEQTLEALPAGQGAVVAAAAAWMAGDSESWRAIIESDTRAPRMATWAARLLGMSGEKEALERLMATGIDPAASVEALEIHASATDTGQGR